MWLCVMQDIFITSLNLWPYNNSRFPTWHIHVCSSWADSSHVAEECNELSWCWAYRSSVDKQVYRSQQEHKAEATISKPKQCMCDQKRQLVFVRAGLTPRTSTSDSTVADPIEHWTGRAESDSCNPADQNGPQGRWGREPAALSEWINTFIMPHVRLGKRSVGKRIPTFSSNGHWDVSKLATLDSGLMRKSPLSWMSWWQQFKCIRKLILKVTNIWFEIRWRCHNTKIWHYQKFYNKKLFSKAF